MNIRIGLAIALFFSSVLQSAGIQPLAQLSKESLLADASQTESLAMQSDGSDEIIVENMKGLLLIGNLDRIETNPNVDGVVLKDLVVPGKESVLVARLEPLIVGHALTQRTLSQIKREIISYYQENDHPVVAVVVPEQDVTDGVLQVTVIEGKIGDVVAKGGRYFTPERMKERFGLKPNDPINTHDLLNAVAWANQNPFRQTNIEFTPGSSSGLTDINIITNDRYPVRVYIGGDNTGNHFTGRNRWYAGFNWGDFFGLDQTLSFQYTTSSDFHKFHGYTLNYTIPLPWHNTLTFFGGYSRVHPKIDPHCPCVCSDSEGWSGQASVRYIIPVGKLYGNFLQNVQVGYDFKATNNSVEFNGREESTHVARVNQFLVGYYGGWTMARSRMNADLDVYFSPGNWYGQGNDKAFNNLQKHANPSYVYARFALGDEMKFSKYDWGLYLLGRGQLASRTLVPSEQFGLGGYDTVRGYEQRLVNYDNAFCLNFELRVPSFSLFGLFGSKAYRDDELTFLGFVDYGIGWPHSAASHSRHNHLDPKSQNLVGVGPGLRYKIGPWFYARVDYGFPLTDVNDKGHSPVLDFGLLCSY